MMILSASDLKAIADAAEAAYPEECCGVLIGRIEADGTYRVSRVAASTNVSTGDRRRNFEVDPMLRFTVMRALGDGPEQMIGHYHSHPDHPAAPSAEDLKRAWEPDLAWLIVGVVDGQTVQATAHVLNPDASGFTEIAVRSEN